MNDVFVVQLAEALEQSDRAVGRIAIEHCQPHSFPIRFELFIFVVAGLPHLERDLQDGADDAKFQIAQPGFDLHAFGTVVVVDMLDLVTKDGCQIITNFPSDRLISCSLPGCEVF